LEIKVLSLDDIFAKIYYYVKKLTGNEKIIHLDYLVLFKLKMLAVIQKSAVTQNFYMP
jgi:hypothetical protein